MLEFFSFLLWTNSLDAGILLLFLWWRGELPIPTGEGESLDDRVRATNLVDLKRENTIWGAEKWTRSASALAQQAFAFQKDSLKIQRPHRSWHLHRCKLLLMTLRPNALIAKFMNFYQLAEGFDAFGRDFLIEGDSHELESRRSTDVENGKMNKFGGSSTIHKTLNSIESYVLQCACYVKPAFQNQKLGFSLIYFFSLYIVISS